MIRYVAFGLLLQFWSCQNPDRNLSTPTSGKITIGVDQSVSILIDRFIEVFAITYPKSDIHTIYSYPDELIKLMADSTIDLMITGYNDDEALNYLETIRQIKPDLELLCWSSTAFIGKSMQLSMHELSGRKILFSSKYSSEQKLFSNFLKDTMQNLFVLADKQEFLDYLKSDSNAVGAIEFSNISDIHDPSRDEYLDSLQIIELRDSGDYTHPGQFDEYPLTHGIYAINLEKRNGLARGFLAFVKSEKGQRLVLKSGLLPAIMPGRDIRLREGFFEPQEL